MSTQLKKSLGIVTAYGAAIQGGYHGTLEEFYAALGGLSTIDLQIETAVGTARSELETELATLQESVTSSIAETEERVLSAYPVVNKTGGMIAFEDGVGLPVKSLTIESTPYQAGDGDPSPDNVRAINGLSSISFNHGSKNCMAIPSTRTKTMSGVTFVQDEDGVTVTGSTTEGAYYACSALVALKPGTYEMTGCPAGGSSTTWGLELIKLSNTSSNRIARCDYGDGLTFTVTESDALNYRYAMEILIEGNVVFPAYWQPMIRPIEILDKTPDTYWRTTYTINAPENVACYGGTIDVLNGKMRSTWARQILDGEDWTVIQISGVTDKVIFQKSINWDDQPVGMLYGKVLCNRLKPVQDITTDSYEIYTISVSSSAVKICLPVEDAGTVTRDYIAEWVANNPVQVAYTCTSVTEYDVEPIDFRPALGCNYLMLGRYVTGKISLEYRANPSLNYIARIG